MAYGRISAKQKEILDFIKHEILNKGYPPSVRDICEAVNLKSTASVHAHFEILDDNFNLARREVINVPLIGTVAAGQPLLAVENIESYFPVPAEYMPNQESFMLHVKGDSMVNAGIFNGDQILVKKQETADNGDIIVALVDDSATVKTYYKEDGHFRLQPENDHMDPIILDKVDILGTGFSAPNSI